MTPEQMRAEYARLQSHGERLAREHLAREQAQIRQRRLERQVGRAGVPPRFQAHSFETYHAETREQQRALRICEQFAERFDELSRSAQNLLLLGRPRTGKTHLACALLQAVIAQGYTGLFARCEDVVMDFRDAHRRDEPERNVLDRYTGIDLLVLDEAGVGTGSDAHRQDRLFAVLNHRAEHLRPSILLGNVTRDELAEWLGERSYQRMVEAGSPVVVFDWQAYDFRHGNPAPTPGARRVEPEHGPASPQWERFVREAAAM